MGRLNNGVMREKAVSGIALRGIGWRKGWDGQKIELEEEAVARLVCTCFIGGGGGGIRCAY